MIVTNLKWFADEINEALNAGTVPVFENKVT